MARSGDGIYQRGGTWWLDFWHQGQRHIEKVGSGISKTSAREIARVKRAAILKAGVGIGRKRKDLSFAKAAELFLKWVESNRRPKTRNSYGENIDQLKKAFGDKDLSQISPFLLEKYKIRRRDEGARVAANRELACLSSLFNRVIGMEKYDGPNPVSKVKKFKESEGRDRILSVEEEQSLLAAANEPCRTIILTAIYTGLRAKSELLTLRKADIDLARGYIEVQAAYAKNGTRRAVPLHPALIEPLRRQMERSESEYVFVKADGVTRLRSIRTAFDGACRRAKLTGVTPHALRHTFATRLVTSGTDLRTVQELGGWKKLDMIQRYANPTEQHKVDAIRRLSPDYSPTLVPTPANQPSGELPQVVEK